jgi:hypothetical protein
MAKRAWTEKRREDARRWRRENPQASLAFPQARGRRLLERAKMAAGGRCVDCGNDDLVVLEFDHVPGRGPKMASVTSIIRCSWSVVLAEIAKCDLVCANCHAHRTRDRLDAELEVRYARP